MRRFRGMGPSVYKRPEDLILISLTCLWPILLSLSPFLPGTTTTGLPCCSQRLFSPFSRTSFTQPSHSHQTTGLAPHPLLLSTAAPTSPRPPPTPPSPSPFPSTSPQPILPQPTSLPHPSPVSSQRPAVPSSRAPLNLTATERCN